MKSKNYKKNSEIGLKTKRFTNEKIFSLQLATLITREFFLSTALFQHLTNDERSREENLSKKHQFMGFSFHKNDALFSSLRTKQKDAAARDSEKFVRFRTFALSDYKKPNFCHKF